MLTNNQASSQSCLTICSTRTRTCLPSPCPTPSPTCSTPPCLPLTSCDPSLRPCRTHRCHCWEWQRTRHSCEITCFACKILWRAAKCQVALTRHDAPVLTEAPPRTTQARRPQVSTSIAPQNRVAPPLRRRRARVTCHVTAIVSLYRPPPTTLQPSKFLITHITFRPQLLAIL